MQDMFDTSVEASQEVLRTDRGSNNLTTSSLELSKRSLINISDEDSEAETNAFDVASQSLDTKSVRPVVTRKLIFRAEKQRPMPARYL